MDLTSEQLDDPFYNNVRCLIGFIQLIFSKRPEGRFKFVEGAEDKETEIIIAGSKALKNDKIPRIIVSRGMTQTIPVAMDNMYSRVESTGEITRKMLVSLPIGINVIARIDTEAQEMAYFIKKNILAHISKIRKIGGFHKIDSTITITPPTDFNAIFTPEVRAEATLVQVGFNTIVPYTYTTMPNDEPLLVRVSANLKN